MKVISYKLTKQIGQIEIETSTEVRRWFKTDVVKKRERFVSVRLPAIDDFLKPVNSEGEVMFNKMGDNIVQLLRLASRGVDITTLTIP